MKKKVEDLEGFELDYIVSKAEGHNDTFIKDNKLWRKFGIGMSMPFYKYSLSTDWNIGGLIIEKIEDVEFYRFGKITNCRFGKQGIHEGANTKSGNTKLEAFMRAYAASKFGEEVEI